MSHDWQIIPSELGDQLYSWYGLKKYMYVCTNEVVGKNHRIVAQWGILCKSHLSRLYIGVFQPSVVHRLFFYSSVLKWKFDKIENKQTISFAHPFYTSEKASWIYVSLKTKTGTQKDFLLLEEEIIYPIFQIIKRILNRQDYTPASPNIEQICQIYILHYTTSKRGRGGVQISPNMLTLTTIYIYLNVPIFQTDSNLAFACLIFKH